MHRRLRRSPLIAAYLTLGVVAWACGGASAPNPSASYAGASVAIEARDLAFNPDILTMPAGQPIRLVLDNRDTGIGHNLHVFQGATDLGQSDTVIGPGTTSVELGQLAPGRYQFECTIHPSMIGTVIVEAGGVAGPSSTDDVPPTDSPGPTDSPAPTGPATESAAPSGS